jgi:energy-coupling factor transporter ATP-binding protein EcfA2
MTKWWKCDLQIATPAWRFEMPAGEQFDLATGVGRRQFADHYMDELVRKGVELVVMADHNTGGWIDLMVEAGTAKGVVVFPGCEITTGSGSDGIHLIIVGDRSKTTHDFDLLLAGPLGFDHEHNRFHTRGSETVPGSSGRTILQILDELPDDFLAIAPHALNDNGIASGNTAQGDIRWKALHHDRLGAIDPGDCTNTAGSSFNALFRRRALDNFPRLKDIAFVSTSDAYKIDDLGSRFCWIRMEEASLEALRQAFLDPEARIICHWDGRLLEHADRSPNRIRHAWIKSLHLGGTLGNSISPLAVEFHPGLNVLIGGRGSGKSTIVAAIRQLYSGFNTLPSMVRQEAEVFSERIFEQARFTSKHHIFNSLEEKEATWSKIEGSLTGVSGAVAVPTNFKVRVVNQKELFERVAHDKHDPSAASRSFLSFVDESLALLKTEPVRPDSWWRTFDDASVEWMTATREFYKLKADLGQLPTIRARIRDLEAQVNTFDSPEAKTRREQNEKRFRQRDFLDERETAFRAYLAALHGVNSEFKTVGNATNPADLDIGKFLQDLENIEKGAQLGVTKVADEAVKQLAAWRKAIEESEWRGRVTAAEHDDKAYLEELKAKGIDPAAYGQLKSQLTQQQALEKALSAKEPKLQSAADRMAAAWHRIEGTLTERRTLRGNLLRDVSGRSGRLDFELKRHRDIVGWSKSVRDLLNLRSDAFLEDVPRLAGWIWGAEDEATQSTRWAMWRDALASGVFHEFASSGNADLRGNWLKRLESMDETVRLRLATEIADDIVQIAFLKDGGSPDRDEDWQDITQGSPGQRTAAMLGFVLHHGDEPLVLDQPEDDLDTEWISKLVVRELRASRWKRQIIVVTHNANIPVNGDAERVIVLENAAGALQIRRTSTQEHCGAIEIQTVREDIQNIMEGGIRAFIQREKKYNNEVKLSATGSI